jgi:uncharacterized protein (DUF488 family)
MPIYTVGHSNHSPDWLFEIIAPFGITHLIDIRRVPYSGRFPHFSRDSIRALCEERDIIYEWWGETLGGTVGSDEDFDMISSGESFRSSIRRLSERFGEDSGKIACLLCAEKDPARCHRSMLIGPALRALEPGGVDLQHILPNGTLISQSMLEEDGLAPRHDRSGTMPLFGDQ